MSSKARLIIFLAALWLPLGGCLLRTHTVERRISNMPLQQATLEELVGKINGEAARIKTLNATVDIATSVGGEAKGKITEYQEIRGYVLLRKPAMLRMIGLFPVVRNRAFDMVSDGQKFRLSLPTKNKFIIGSKDVTQPSTHSLENLRPQHILDALLVKEVDPKSEIAVLESGIEVVRDAKSKKEVTVPSYQVAVIGRADDGKWYLLRKIVFSRTDLLPRKQVLYNKQGNVVTIATYDNYSEQYGLMFPNIIQVERPQEEYSIQLGIVKLKLNEPLRDDQFDLQQPQGAQLVNLDLGQRAHNSQ